MEPSLIKFSAEPALRFFAQLANFELPDLVRQCLPWPNDVPVNFRNHVLIRLSRVFAEIVDGLLTRPAHRVHAGIDHQPHPPPHFLSKLAKFQLLAFDHPPPFSHTPTIHPPPSPET